MFKLRIRKAAEDRKRLYRRFREGVLTKDASFKQVSHDKWNMKWEYGDDISVDWLEGEKREILADDVLYSWFHGHGMAMRGGYALERRGIIVANILTIMS